MSICNNCGSLGAYDVCEFSFTFVVKNRPEESLLLVVRDLTTGEVFTAPVTTDIDSQLTIDSAGFPNAQSGHSYRINIPLAANIDSNAPLQLVGDIITDYSCLSVRFEDITSL